MIKTSHHLIEYQWKGISPKGQTSHGVIRARGLTMAKAMLKKQGITVQRITKKRKPLFLFKPETIKSTDVTLFSRQLATLIKAGIPLIQSFDIVAKGQIKPRMKALIEIIKKQIESGFTLAEALRKHPVCFNDLFCNLVDAGEKSGTLDTMLDKVASYKENIETIKKKIKKALAYPLAVMMIALTVTSSLLMFVVPHFETLFKSFGAELPALTQAVISVSKGVQKDWYLILGSIYATIKIFSYAKKQSKKFAYVTDKTMLKIPILGTLLKQAAIARFARTLSITFAAGLPLLDALKAVAGATGNLIFSEACHHIEEAIANGQQIHVAMEHMSLFPSMVIQMVAIGEESGTLEKMLCKVADFYEEDVDNSVEAFNSLVEPLIMSILGVLIGGLVVAMYLPIFKLGSVM